MWFVIRWYDREYTYRKVPKTVRDWTYVTIDGQYAVYDTQEQAEFHGGIVEGEIPADSNDTIAVCRGMFVVMPKP